MATRTKLEVEQRVGCFFADWSRVLCSVSEFSSCGSSFPFPYGLHLVDFLSRWLIRQQQTLLMPGYHIVCSPDRLIVEADEVLFSSEAEQEQLKVKVAVLVPLVLQSTVNQDFSILSVAALVDICKLISLMWLKAAAPAWPRRSLLPLLPRGQEQACHFIAFRFSTSCPLMGKIDSSR